MVSKEKKIRLNSELFDSRSIITSCRHEQMRNRSLGIKLAFCKKRVSRVRVVGVKIQLRPDLLLDLGGATSKGRRQVK